MKIIIAVPAYNEEKILVKNIARLQEFCHGHFFGEYLIVVVDNNSQDATSSLGRQLAEQQENVEYLFVADQGKGLAIRAAWESFSADVYCFMDADLAIDLSALPVLIDAVSQESYDLAIGSRFHRQSIVDRSLIRKFFSQGYRLVLKLLLGIKIADAPCGFKAISQKVKDEVLPRVQDTKWFFDSELVIIAEKLGYKIKEIPVHFHNSRTVDDPSRVAPIKLTLDYLKKALVLKARLKVLK